MSDFSFNRSAANVVPARHDDVAHFISWLTDAALGRTLGVQMGLPDEQQLHPDTFNTDRSDAVDVFRGLTIWLMVRRGLVAAARFQRTQGSPEAATHHALRSILVGCKVFVNYGGAAIPLFRHAPWDGMTVADVV